MDIDCDWCICGKKTSNGRLYCSEECKLSDCASDSSGNSEYSYLSNSSMGMSNNYIPAFYNKAVKKNYYAFINGAKGHKPMNGIITSITTKGYGNNTINHSSPNSQIPLSTKYNQTNLARSTVGGLVNSNLIPINNISVVTTHVYTSGQIIKTSTSAPKVTENDSNMTSSTNLYNRRYSVPFNKNGTMNLTVNTTDTSTTTNMNENMVQEALNPPPFGILKNGMVNTTYTSFNQQINDYNEYSRSNSLNSGSTCSSSCSSQVDDDQTLHSFQSISNPNSLGQIHEGPKVVIQSYTKTLKPITEGIVSGTTNTTTNINYADESNPPPPPPSLPHHSSSSSSSSPYSLYTTTSATNTTNTTTNTTNTTTITHLKTTKPKTTNSSIATPPTSTTTTHPKNSHDNNNNYTLYKTSASTNLYKMMSGRAKAPMGHRQTLFTHTTKSSSVESAASTNHVTPIYF